MHKKASKVLMALYVASRKPLPTYAPAAVIASSSTFPPPR